VKHIYYSRLHNNDSELSWATRDTRSDRAGSIKNRRKARNIYIKRRRYGIYDKKAKGPLRLKIGVDREARPILKGRGPYKTKCVKNVRKTR
jgi:hypothetical protein